MSQALKITNDSSDSSAGFMNYIARYDSGDLQHRAAFIELLQLQAKEHGRTVTDEAAGIVSNVIGREYEVTLICGPANGVNVVKGMTVTKEADYPWGRYLYLEDLVVGKRFRGQRLGLQLLNQNLLHAWEGGMKGWPGGLPGFGWETNFNNDRASRLYERIKPSFNPSNSEKIWRFSVSQAHKLIEKPGERAVVATSSEMGTIYAVLGEDINYGRVVQILDRQKNGNGVDEDSYLMAERQGGLAFVSEAFSTFRVGVRADARLVLHPNVTDERLRSLMRGTINELKRRRRWQQFTSVTVEILGDVPRSDQVENAFRGMGAEVLQHNNDPMAVGILNNEEYVRAVVKADKSLTNGTRLSGEARSRLIEAASDYGIEFDEDRARKTVAPAVVSVSNNGSVVVRSDDWENGRHHSPKLQDSNLFLSNFRPRHSAQSQHQGRLLKAII